MTLGAALAALTSARWRRGAAAARLERTVKPCIHCGGEEAYVVPTRVVPDFDPAKLEPALRRAFLMKQNGYCVICGLYQDFNRLGPEHLKALNALGKDALTSETAYAAYPPPAEHVAAFNARHFGRRLERWNAFFAVERPNIASALFLRVWFGAAPRFVADRFGAATAGLDMSAVCLRYTQEALPQFTALDGDINGVLDGPFLATGPYDAVFTFHILNHSCDITAALRQIRNLLRPGGFALFSNEIERKPANPFHNIHPSEVQFVALLREVFARIERIDDCEDGFVPHASPFTVKHDIPDIVAWA
ncbi:MAG TPA: class I SAM-dependent methyltransferase [Stellaceae bacterium]|nr:class I SAM-dependent methyltransferase [Stellaceae bacterium]